MSKPIVAADVQPDSDTHLPAALAKDAGHSEWRVLGEQFGLSQFGVNLETLGPGGRSSLKHWHTENDEFIYVLHGELVLSTSLGEYVVKQGMCAGFKGGVANAHHLLNRSNAPAKFLVVGTRNRNDAVIYPENDLQWLDDGQGGRRAARKDGNFYE